ncbi:hypothetical protein JOB18_012543 [Solea senegalensis]|uniref:Uncharacterized protein n=1 Tax=Solea senegalensis TaxID=28829 RepID=A0AAV6PAN5_SOLSE|nr:hypothetical protein JOB18_012543 [Solea senegalensis]
MVRSQMENRLNRDQMQIFNSQRNESKSAAGRTATVLRHREHTCSEKNENTDKIIQKMKSRINKSCKC